MRGAISTAAVEVEAEAAEEVAAVEGAMPGTEAVGAEEVAVVATAG